MTLYLRRKTDLDLDDPRRWKRPNDGFSDDCWDQGLVSVSPGEYLEAVGKKREEERRKLEEHQKQSGWFQCDMLRGLLKRKAKRLGYRPSCTTGVYTNDPDAHNSAVKSCNGCGITHWRRHCPLLNRDQGAPETGPK